MSSTNRPHSQALRCPICATQVDPLRSAHVVVTEQGLVHLCSVSCRQAWLESPTPVSTLVQSATRSMVPGGSVRPPSNVIAFRGESVLPPAQELWPISERDFAALRTPLFWKIALGAAGAVFAWVSWKHHPVLSVIALASIAIRIAYVPYFFGELRRNTAHAAKELHLAFENAVTWLHLGKTSLLAWRQGNLLTRDEWHVERILRNNHFDTASVLMAAACCEATISDVPLAKAVLAAASEHGIRPPPARNSSFTLGAGVSAADMSGHHYAIGSRTYLLDLGFMIASAELQARDIEDAGMTALFVGIDGRIAGVLALKRVARKLAQEAIAYAHQVVPRNVLYSADSPVSSAALASSFGFSEYKACVSSADFAAMMRHEQSGDDWVTLVSFPGDTQQALEEMPAVLVIGSSARTRQPNAIHIGSTDLRRVSSAIALAQKFHRQWLFGLGVALTTWCVVLICAMLQSWIAVAAAALFLALELTLNRQTVRLFRDLELHFAAK